MTKKKDQDEVVEEQQDNPETTTDSNAGDDAIQGTVADADVKHDTNEK